MKSVCTSSLLLASSIKEVSYKELVKLYAAIGNKVNAADALENYVTSGKSAIWGGSGSHNLSAIMVDGDSGGLLSNNNGNEN